MPRASVRHRPRGRRRRRLGVAAMIGAVSISAANFVLSRWSLTSSLSAYDLTALRFGVAGALLLPFLVRRGIVNLGGIGWRRGAILACLIGAPYILLVFWGLQYVPAARGVAINNGAVPIVTAVGMWIAMAVEISWRKASALGLIVLGLMLVTSIVDVSYPGDLLWLLSGISWAVFMVMMRWWRLEAVLVTAVASVLSLTYIPVYVFVLGPTMGHATVAHVVFQSINQGVISAIVALFLFAYGVEVLGPNVAAVFVPLGPVLTAVFAMVILAEFPTRVQCVGIVLVAVGMAGAARYESAK